MKQNLFGWLAVCLMAIPAFAETPPATTVVEAKGMDVKVLSIRNPASYAGIQLGDVLQRSIRISVPAQAQLDENSLPLKGLQRQGIELRQWQVSNKAESGRKIYTLVFDYQVFASLGKPVQLQLPAEHIAFNSGAVAELPAWRFWLMAQLPDRLQPGKPTVIAQYPPTLQQTDITQRWLGVSLMLVLVGALVLLYSNADWGWLPMMNGHFARAYRQLKRLPATADGQKQATLLVQQAFNASFGQQMLASHVPEFVARQPVFQSLQSQIEVFFHTSQCRVVWWPIAGRRRIYAAMQDPDTPVTRL